MLTRRYTCLDCGKSAPAGNWKQKRCRACAYWYQQEQARANRPPPKIGACPDCGGRLELSNHRQRCKDCAAVRARAQALAAERAFRRFQKDPEALARAAKQLLETLNQKED